MQEQRDIKFAPCNNCGERNYNLIDGFYYCEECGEQNAAKAEMEYDHIQYETLGQRTRKLLNKKQKPKVRRLTSWEEYNYILLGLVNELQEIDDGIPNFKKTVLQLWITYLQQNEVAFFNTENVDNPKLFASYRQADAEILYNKKPKQKKKNKPRPPKQVAPDDIEGNARQRRRQIKKSENAITRQLSESDYAMSESLNSSLLANMSIESISCGQQDEEADIEFCSNAKKFFRKRKIKIDDPKVADLDNAENLRGKRIEIRQLNAFKERHYLMTGSTILSILACGLNICGSSIQISDLVRFVREGYVSYYKCIQFLPDDYVHSVTKLSHFEHHFSGSVTDEYMRRHIGGFTGIMPDVRSSFRLPDMSKLCRRYITEMRLPEDFFNYIERLIIMFPPKMQFFATLESAPNYEGRAMAYIVFLLKLFFGLDDHREKEISESARNLNRFMQNQTKFDNPKIFVYDEWTEYIEYRNIVLQRYYFPTIFHCDAAPEKPYEAYNKMLDALRPKTKHMENFETATGKLNLPRLQAKQNAKSLLQEFIKQHDDDEDLMSKFSFPLSMTPYTDHFEFILKNIDVETVNINILSIDHSKLSIDYFLEPEKLVNIFQNAGVNLKLQRSKFPRNFVFKKNLSRRRDPKMFKMSFDITEDKWRNKVKQRQAEEKNEIIEAEAQYHRKHMTKILKKRRFWRQEIKKKHLRDQEKASEKEIVDENQPRKFQEQSVLDPYDYANEPENSEEDEIADFDEMNKELDDIFEMYKNPLKFEADNEMKFITSNFNMWKHRKVLVNRFEYIPNAVDRNMFKLPKSFQWLLNISGNIINQKPAAVLQQILIVENEFMNVYQPMELFENILLKQNYPYCEKFHNLY